MFRNRNSENNVPQPDNSDAEHGFEPHETLARFYEEESPEIGRLTELTKEIDSLERRLREIDSPEMHRKLTRDEFKKEVDWITMNLDYKKRERQKIQDQLNGVNKRWAIRRSLGSSGSRLRR